MRVELRLWRMGTAGPARHGVAKYGAMAEAGLPRRPISQQAEKTPRRHRAAAEHALYHTPAPPASIARAMHAFP